MEEPVSQVEGTALRRFERIGKDRSLAVGENWTSVGTESLDVTWVKTMATALCMEREFHILLRSTWLENGGEIYLSAPWKAALHLQMRYSRYNNYEVNYIPPLFYAQLTTVVAME